DALLAIWNPIPLYNGRNERPGGAWNGGRTPLVAAWSRDNGRTFSMPVALETEEESGYCYVAIHCLKDAVLLAYCAGSAQDGMCLTRQRIRRIPYAAL
ncbi:MAG: sialidase family protein, partial [Clostridia bacterium]